MDFSVPQCFGWARERPYHHNWWRGRASLPFFVHSFSASTFRFLVYLSNQSYYLDRCVQPFLRILFSLGTPAKTLLKKCEMIHLRRLSGSLPVDSVWRNVLAISAMSSTRIPTKCESPWSPCRMNSLPIRRLCLNCVTINTSSRINSGHATGSILRHHTARFSARWPRGFTRSKNDVTQPSRHHAMHRIPMQGILDWPEKIPTSLYNFEKDELKTISLLCCGAIKRFVL